MLEDVAGDEGFVDARVFVGFKLVQRFFRDAFVLRSCCSAPPLAMNSTADGARWAVRTFTRRHGGLGDWWWERHGARGSRLIYTGFVSGPLGHVGAETMRDVTCGESIKSLGAVSRRWDRWDHAFGLGASGHIKFPGAAFPARSDAAFWCSQPGSLFTGTSSAWR
jgi:hypothetical protein